jgi:orotidine-5'-phosphate decarboxylase
VTFEKLGLEFCMSGQYFEVIEELHRRGKEVFADLKFSDVPATVRGAVANLARCGATFCTLHGRACPRIVEIGGGAWWFSPNTAFE